MELKFKEVIIPILVILLISIIVSLFALENLILLTVLISFSLLTAFFLTWLFFYKKFTREVFEVSKDYPEIADYKAFFRVLKEYLSVQEQSLKKKDLLEADLKEHNLDIKRLENSLKNLQKDKDEVRLINRFLLHKGDTIYAIKNTKSIFVAVSEKYTALFGKDYEDITGKEEFMIFPERKTSQYLDEEKSLLEQEKSLVYDEKIDDKWYQVVKKPLIDPNGKIFGIMEMIKNVSERKKAEYLLEDSYIKLHDSQNKLLELEQKNSVMAMAVTANHELNQPLTVIKGHLGILEKKLEILTLSLNSADSVEKFIKESSTSFDRINSSVDRMAKILEKFRNAESFNFAQYVNDTQMIVFNEEAKDSNLNNS